MKPDDETIEARTETAGPSLSNRPLPLDWRSSEPNPSSSSGTHQYDMSSGTIRECLAAPHRQGEAWKGVPLGENPYISKWPLPKANERTTNKGIEGSMDTAAPDVGPSQPKASLALDWRSSPPLLTSSSEANIEDPYRMGEACRGALPGENPSPPAKSRGTNDECAFKLHKALLLASRILFCRAGVSDMLAQHLSNCPLGPSPQHDHDYSASN